MGIDATNIAEGQKANLVVFDIDEEWAYTKENNQSKSSNSPFIGQNLKGRVLLTYNNSQQF